MRTCREERSIVKTVKRSENSIRLAADKKKAQSCVCVCKNMKHIWPADHICDHPDSSVHICWPSLTGLIRFETKIDGCASLLWPETREKYHRHTWFLSLYVCGTGCMPWILRIQIRIICIWIYTCKGNITDGRGFQPQRFTGVPSLVLM